MGKLENIEYDNEKGIYKFTDNSTIIKFQNGVVPENGVNGIQIEDLIKVGLLRIEYLNSRKSDVYNRLTNIALETALEAQLKRTADREQRGVEGTEKD